MTDGFCDEIKKLRRQLVKDGVPHSAVRRHGKTAQGYEISIPCREEPSITITERLCDSLMTAGIHRTSGVEIVRELTAEEAVKLIKKSMVLEDIE